MAALNKHLGWIQLVLLIIGMAFIYGQQIAGQGDLERRTGKCEKRIEMQSSTNEKILAAVNQVRIDVAGIKTDIKYLSGLE